MAVFNPVTAAVGVAAQKALIYAVQRYKPLWLVLIEHASPELDIIRKVDVLAHVRYPSGDVEPVPIQVRSGKKAEAMLQDFFLKNPGAIGNVIGFPFKWDLSDVRVCIILYRELRAVRKANKRFGHYLDLKGECLGEEGEALKRNMLTVEHTEPFQRKARDKAEWWEHLYLLWLRF